MMKKTATKQWLAVKRLAVNVTALLVTVSLLLSMAGCGPEKAAVDEEKVPKIGFIYETMTVERWQRDMAIFVAKARTWAPMSS